MSPTTSPAELRRLALVTEASLTVATPIVRVLLAGSVVMAIAFCSANLAVLDDLDANGVIQLGLHSATVPALVFALLAGAYSASTDRRVGFVEQRLLSDSSRSRWLGGKAVVQGVVGVTYGVLGVATALVTCSAVFALRGSSFDATDPEVVKALIGVLIAAPLLAILGVVVGSLITNTPVAVAGIMAWSLVIEPPVILGLPAVGKWLPTAGALGLTNSPNPDLASQWAGGLVLAGYATVGFLVVNRRIRDVDL